VAAHFKEMESELAQMDSKHTNVMDFTLNTLNEVKVNPGVKK